VTTGLAASQEAQMPKVEAEKEQNVQSAVDVQKYALAQAKAAAILDIIQCDALTQNKKAMRFMVEAYDAGRRAERERCAKVMELLIAEYADAQKMGGLVKTVADAKVGTCNLALAAIRALTGEPEKKERK
jgi:hypothetical protein